MSSESIAATTSVVKFVSSADGDVILRSSDGVEFRADSAVLKRASPVFEDMAKLPSLTNEPLATPVVAMEETSDVLAILLCLLYPTDSPPRITSISQGRALLRVVDKLQITSFVVLQTLEAYVATVEPPLAAWAITMNSSVPSLRRAGVRRVFMADENTDLTLDAPEELRDVSAHAVVRLLAAKKEALEEARKLLTYDSFPWAIRKDKIPSHEVGGKLSKFSYAATDWSILHTERMVQYPFDLTYRSETFLHHIIFVNDDKMLGLFQSPGRVAQRAKARSSIERLLEWDSDA